MVSKVITVPQEFFEEVLPILKLSELQVLLQVIYDQRWQLGRADWSRLNVEYLWDKFGLDDLEVVEILEELAKRRLLEVREEAFNIYVKLR